MREVSHEHERGECEREVEEQSNNELRGLVNGPMSRVLGHFLDQGITKIALLELRQKEVVKTYLGRKHDGPCLLEKDGPNSLYFRHRSLTLSCKNMIVFSDHSVFKK